MSDILEKWRINCQEYLAVLTTCMKEDVTFDQEKELANIVNESNIVFYSRLAQICDDDRNNFGKDDLLAILYEEKNKMFRRKND